MPKISRLSGCTHWIDLDFVERQRTPERAMKISIQLQVVGFSLSNTISTLESWVSSNLAKQSTIGYRRLIYTPQRAESRITLQLTKP
ncbi:hypothetical protein SAMN05192561_11813 [Halopenitus malekzadehii]|uniref:Uncharacterized protein n=1 Tax=Halopenitus malekzadehii TaxID=1267564 RepID=A0A1H6JU58_9EURY|nr:hypothetical protein SAMN05192561_11813 [Halopenitus malekzadehii]